MTQLISSAFQQILQQAKKIKGKKKGLVLLIDEADAVVQSRDLAQMHHEDRAGVNAVLRGIDDLAGKNLPLLIIMCTNRLDAIDSAVRRRAGAVFEFFRPDSDQRKSLLESGLGNLQISKKEIDQLDALTGVEPGYTYSDFTQRLFPTIVLDAFPDRPISFDIIEAAVRKTKPTPPFGENGGNGKTE